MLDTSARLLRLLSLLQSRRYWSGASLAERLEVTERTVRRDIDRLRSLGYPVQAASGVAGGYQLGAGADLPPLLLDDDEALAVTIGLRSASNGSVTGIEEAAVRALSKLDQVLPARLSKRVQALHQHIVPLHPAQHSVDPRALSTIAGACRDHERLRFDYTARAGVASERQVDPYGLVHTGYLWYLVAWDVSRDDWRTFRVDRMTSRPSTLTRFTPRPPPDADLAAYVTRSVSSSTHSTPASVVLHASLATLSDRLPRYVGSLESLAATRCRLTVVTHSVDSVAVWIAMLGVEFEIENPPELRDRLRQLAERLERATRASG